MIPMSAIIFYKIDIDSDISPSIYLSISISLPNRLPCPPRILIVGQWGSKTIAEDRGTLVYITNVLVSTVYNSDLVITIFPVFLPLHIHHFWCHLIHPHPLQVHILIYSGGDTLASRVTGIPLFYDWVTQHYGVLKCWWSDSNIFLMVEIQPFPERYTDHS